MKKNVYLLILIALFTLNVQQLYAQVQPRSQDAYWHTRGNVDLPENYLLGTLDAKPLYFVTNKATRLYIGSTGNIGIGGVTDPHATLQLSNVNANRRLVLYEGSNNDHNFYGLGINDYAMRYQVGQIASHVFYATDNTDKERSRVLFRISGEELNGSLIVPDKVFLKFETPNNITNNIDHGIIASGRYSSNGALDITGASDDLAKGSRQITMWAEGGTEFKGDIKLLPKNNATQGGIRISNNGFIQVGYRTSGAPVTDGIIGYKQLSEGLDIIGVGSSQAKRTITMHAEGGTEFKGNVTLTGYAPSLGIGVTTAKEAFHVSGKNILLETPEGVSGLMGRLATGTGLYLGTRSEHGVAIGTGGSASMYMDINGIVYLTKNPVSTWTANPPAKLLTDQCRLFVQGGIVSEKFYHIPVGQWADHVFENGYRLKDLDEVRKYITLNKHLPGIPSQAQVAKEGYDMHDMNTKFLAKIEELTLYAISQKDQIDALQQQVKQYSTLSNEISQLKKQLQNLQNK